MSKHNSSACRSADKPSPTDPQPEKKRWYCRGYLPHCDDPRLLQSITFRLADSLPLHVRESLEAELHAVPYLRRNAERRRRIEQWLDAGLGCCALGHPEVADVMQPSLLKFNSERYDLIDWCIMPNHVHALIKPHTTLSKIVQSWKSYVGRWAIQRNGALGLKIPAGSAFWMEDYWDRYIRNAEHFANTRTYIRNNPVRAGLCPKPEDWKWSSAGYTGIGSWP